MKRRFREITIKVNNNSKLVSDLLSSSIKSKPVQNKNKNALLGDYLDNLVKQNDETEATQMHLRNQKPCIIEYRSYVEEDVYDRVCHI